MKFPHLEKVMQEYSMYLLKDTGSNLPDTYRIKSKLNFVFEIDGNFYEIIFHAPKYFKWVEEGRPGRKSSTPPDDTIKNPPVSVIEDWITVKHITPRRIKGILPTKKQLAFIISNAIGEHGTKYTPTFALSRALDTDKSYWNDQIDKAVFEDVYDNVDALLKLHR